MPLFPRRRSDVRFQDSRGARVIKRGKKKRKELASHFRARGGNTAYFWIIISKKAGSLGIRRLDKKAVVEIKIVDKLDLPVGEFVGGFRNSKRGARCALFDSLSRGETRGNVVEFQAAPTASRINFRANRIDSGPLAICLDRDKRRSATLEAAQRGATPTTLSTLLREDGHSWFTSALFYSIHRNCILAGITLSIM